MLKHLAKGAYITIRGQLKNRQWIDNVGNRREDIVIVVKEYNIHEWMKKSKVFESLRDSNGELLIPREVTDSLFKQINERDEDIPNFNERDIDDLF